MSAVGHAAQTALFVTTRNDGATERVIYHLDIDNAAPDNVADRLHAESNLLDASTT